jgi:hypothetical protein
MAGAMLHTLGTVIAGIFAAYTAVVLFLTCMAVNDHLRDNALAQGAYGLCHAAMSFGIGYVLARLGHSEVVFFKTAVISSGIITGFIGLTLLLEPKNRATAVGFVLTVAWGGILLVLWTFYLS